ncbi:PH domain-containing protein [Calycomorphotria hydatis]|uniref:Bacterial membrane flanked domain protein n=1 Tax=Calycomorphotria hydatis TaxID=2528027 RepID=A0A517T656_9PLAN|nr:PH domain-containing protein [Calycomorphotria hydatis]QDT63853.1 Bacterial membrane flanked domain protein [Calycomorphotria hydatis]
MSSTTIEQVTYECPSCGASIDIAVQYVGEEVDCPNCSLPFEAEAPTAHPKFTSETQRRPSAFTISRPTDDETVVRNLHPSMFRNYPLVFVGVTFALVAGLASLTLGLMGGSIIGLIGSCIITSVSAGYFVYWYIWVMATTLTVTNKRTTLEYGIISRRSSEVQHDDVRNLQVNQNIWQRLVGVGDLAISSSGQDDLEIQVRGIAYPDDVADEIRRMQ